MRLIQIAFCLGLFSAGCSLENLKPGDTGTTPDADADAEMAGTCMDCPQSATLSAA